MYLPSEPKFQKTSHLEAVGLEKSYGKRPVVKGVSFQIRAGEVVGILGPNGAGKTTSFYMVVGLIQPDAGEVKLDGHPITSWPMHRRAQAGLAYLPQESSVFRQLTVADNIEAVLELRGLSVLDRQKKLDQLLSDFRLEAVKDQMAFTLSGGERRRVEVARALALEPKFLLLDEPFAGIDPLAVADIQAMIQSLKTQGIGVLITDHNVRETLAICDLGYLLSDGRILEHGTPSEIINSPKAREHYLGSGFRL